MKTLGERLYFFRSTHLKIGQPEFVEAVNRLTPKGISQQNLSQWENNETEPSRKKMAAIEKAYPELNRNWLEKGDGKMLIDDDLKKPSGDESMLRLKIAELENKNSVLAEKYTAALEELLRLKNKI